MNRRSFIRQSLTIAAAMGSNAALSSAEPPPSTVPPASETAKPAELKRPPPLAGATVFDFVRAGHNDLPKVKKMLAEEPLLLNAMWDWGKGDWETALGGASHLGNREIALHLLEAGARIDAFCATMLGERVFVKELLRFDPYAANARGPHGFTLLYHVGYTGDVELATAVSEKIVEKRAKHFNQSLQSAVARGHVDLVQWLLGNGVDDPNTKYFDGKTPLDLATSKQLEQIIQMLRAAGGVSGSA